MHIRSYFDHVPVVPDSVYLDEFAVVIGDVVMGEDCSVWPMVSIRGDVHRIRIGARTNIQDGSVLHVTHYGEYNPEGSPLTVGDEVTIGHGVVVHACTVGHRCLLGMHSTILDDAVIEDNVLLGAHSLVTPGKRLESGFLYAGSPAKKNRALTTEEVDFLAYSADHYVHLKNKHLSQIVGP